MEVRIDQVEMALSDWSIILGRKRRGTKPSHFAPGSKHLARSVLQSLQTAGLIQENVNNPTG